MGIKQLFSVISIIIVPLSLFPQHPSLHPSFRPLLMPFLETRSLLVGLHWNELQKRSTDKLPMITRIRRHTKTHQDIYKHTHIHIQWYIQAHTHKYTHKYIFKLFSSWLGCKMKLCNYHHSKSTEVHGDQSSIWEQSADWPVDRTHLWSGFEPDHPLSHDNAFERRTTCTGLHWWRNRCRQTGSRNRILLMCSWKELKVYLNVTQTLHCMMRLKQANIVRSKLIIIEMNVWSNNYFILIAAKL